MPKLRNLLQSRSQLFQNTFYVDSVKNSLWVHGLTSSTGISTDRQNFVGDGKFIGRVFAPYTIYKGKAALSASPRLPTFSKMDAGGLKLDRRGVIMLTFWPSIGERKYDWEKKQMFALSATEVGSLISISARDSCEFFHDPSMLSSNAGQVRKSFSIKPLADSSGYFFSLSVVNNILKNNERFTVPVTTAEFSVMRTAFSFALPHILGWEQVTNQVPESTNENPSRVTPQLRDLEWDR